MFERSMTAATRLAGLLLAATAVAAPAHAALVTYTYNTTSQGFGTHVDQPSVATFQVDSAVLLTGKFGTSDITNIHLAYPGLTLNTYAAGVSSGIDPYAYVDTTTGSFVFNNSFAGLGVIGYAGTDINSATTFLSITIDAEGFTQSGQLLGTISDTFNALNNGASYSGFPTKGFWSSNLRDVVNAPPVTDPSAAPEPAAWAVMLIGFGAIGTAMRRRQTVRATFA